MNTSILTVPTSITAKSRGELTKQMLIIQRKLESKLHFFDIQFVKGEWVAWYEADFKNIIKKAK